MPPAWSREGAAEAPVPWFPPEKALTRTAPVGTKGTREARASLSPLPRVPDPARPYPEPASREGGRRAGAGRQRTAGSREAAASARRPAPSFYPSGRRSPPARRQFAYRAARLQLSPARGHEPSGRTAERGRCSSVLGKNTHAPPPRGAGTRRGAGRADRVASPTTSQSG